MESADDEVLERALADMHDVLGDAIAAQRKLVEVTGTAWSEDRLVKAVVGPRGQLVDLEIDPRVGNRMNTEALARTILAVTQAATEQAMARAREIVEQDVPDTQDVRNIAVPGGFDLTDLMANTDADLRRMLEEEEEDR